MGACSHCLLVDSEATVAQTVALGRTISIKETTTLQTIDGQLTPGGQASPATIIA